MSYLKSVGILIHYYRKKENIKIKDFIIDVHNKEICSSKTLRSIEKGSIHKIDFFNDLCTKINKKFFINNQLIEKIDQLNDSLILSLEKMSINDLKLIYNELFNLKINKQWIFYYEYILLYRDIINYHLYNIIPDNDNIEIFKALLNIDNPKLTKLILSFLYSISNINTVNINKKDIVDKCQKYLDDPLFFNLYLSDIYNKNSLLNSYQIYTKMLENENLNLYQKTYLNYMIALCLLNSEDSNTAYETLEKVLKNTPKNYFPSEFEVRINCCMGICAYKTNKYNVAVEYFNNAYILNFAKINYNYLYYFYCLEQVNEIGSIIRICEEIDINKLQNDLVKHIINYYTIKTQKHIGNTNKWSILEKILVEDLIKLNKLGDGYITIIKYELSKICDITGNYHLLNKFV